MTDFHWEEGDRSYWDEDELVPASPQEMRDGIREAMVKFAHLLPKPEDATCACLTCRMFRDYLGQPRAEGATE